MTSCPVCHLDLPKVHFRKGNFTILKCPHCGFMMASLPPAGSPSPYSSSYFRSWGMEQGDSPSVQKMKRKTAGHLLRDVERYTVKGRLLDVGCAAGHFLEEAAFRHWDVYGVEISPYAATLARKKFGDKILVGSFLDVPLSSSFFQAVIMSDVIEHFPDPQPVLDKAWTILQPQGVLAIVTPNTESLSALVMGRAWPHFHKEHLSYFNPQSMDIALKNHGFRLISMKASPKWINLNYAQAQFRVYRHPFITPTINLLTRLIPNPFKEMDIPLILGDLRAIARKEDG